MLFKVKVTGYPAQGGQSRGGHRNKKEQVDALQASAQRHLGRVDEEERGRPQMWVGVKRCKSVPKKGREKK